MDWLTKELTAIEKIRRNVVLLATLSLLISFFPVETDQISLVGATFSSDVVGFGLFHALIFYSSVLGVRTFIQWRLHDISQRKLEDAIEASESDVQRKYESEIAATNVELEQLSRPVVSPERLKRADDADYEAEALQRQVQEVERQQTELRRHLEQMRDQHMDLMQTRTRAEHAFTESITKFANDAETQTAYEQAREDQTRYQRQADLIQAEIMQAESQLGRIHEVLSEIRSKIPRGDFAGARDELLKYEEQKLIAKRKQLENRVGFLKQKSARRISQLRGEGPFAKWLAGYVIVGEYFFPVLLGTTAAAVLFLSQDITMLWELHLINAR